jgi:hypothetical protein
VNNKVPKGAFVHQVFLDLCAADLLSNLRFEQMGCDYTIIPQIELPKLVELELFAVGDDVYDLDEYQWPRSGQ